MMGLTFQEKSLWLMFVSITLVFATYFVFAIDHASANVLPQHIMEFGIAVVALVVIAIVGHTLIAIVDRPAGLEDERQKLIQLKGKRNGSYVLGVGLLAAMGTALQFHGNFVFVHTAFAFLVLGALADVGTQLYLYRRMS